MRALVWVVIAVAVTWGGYWFVGARALETGAQAWFQAQTEAGLVAERSDLSVSGFPNRFDLTVTDLRLADPDAGFGWTAPFVQILSLSYKPWHIIAAFANQQGQGRSRMILWKRYGRAHEPVDWFCCCCL